jgi:acyl carrier protein
MIIEMTRDWDVSPDDLHPDTSLFTDLMFSSVDVIHLLGLVEMKFQKKFPYDRLVVDELGRYRDLTIGDITRFVQDHIDYEDAGPAPAR